MKSIAFKGVLIYRLSRDVDLQTSVVNESLKNFLFTPCGSQSMATAGWVETIGDYLTHESGQYLLLTMQREEKIIPPHVIKEKLNEQIAKLEQEQGRKLRKTEKDSLKDEVLHSLLPRAFTRKSRSRLIVDRKEGLVFVEGNSARKAEDMLALLRKSLGSLPVVPMTAAEPLELTITEWIRNGFPRGFTAGTDVILKAILEDGGAVRCKKQDLHSEEVLTHINAGKVATSVGLNYIDRASFRLCDDMTIKGLTFCDELYDQNDDIEREDVMQRFDADFILFTAELSALFSALMEAIGGEAQR